MSNQESYNYSKISDAIMNMEDLMAHCKKIAREVAAIPEHWTFDDLESSDLVDQYWSHVNQEMTRLVLLAVVSWYNPQALIERNRDNDVKFPPSDIPPWRMKE